jgi:hypothetical protein
VWGHVVARCGQSIVEYRSGSVLHFCWRPWRVFFVLGDAFLLSALWHPTTRSTHHNKTCHGKGTRVVDLCVHAAVAWDVSWTRILCRAAAATHAAPDPRPLATRLPCFFSSTPRHAIYSILYPPSFPPPPPFSPSHRDEASIQPQRVGGTGAAHGARADSRHVLWSKGGARRRG